MLWSSDSAPNVESQRVVFAASIEESADQPAKDVLLFSDLGARKARSQILVREGESIDVGAAGSRILTILNGRNNSSDFSPTSGSPSILNGLGHICFVAGVEAGDAIFVAHAPRQVIHQPDIVVKSANGDLVTGRNVYETEPTQPQRFVIELSRGQSVDLKVCIQNDGTVDDSFDVSGKMPPVGGQPVGGFSSPVVLTRVSDASNQDVTDSMLHPKGRKNYPTGVLAPQAIQEFTFRTTIPNDLKRNALGKDNKVTIKLRARSRSSQAASKPIDTFEIEIGVTDPL
jgi:hypothetical protein